jgi:class 3 adenylate cyclase
VVRAIGSVLHMDYTAVGQTKHLATRMEEITDPGASYNKGVVKFRKVKIRTL